MLRVHVHHHSIEHAAPAPMETSMRTPPLRYIAVIRVPADAPGDSERVTLEFAEMNLHSAAYVADQLLDGQFGDISVLDRWVEIDTTTGMGRDVTAEVARACMSGLEPDDLGEFSGYDRQIVSWVEQQLGLINHFGMWCELPLKLRRAA
jgi:hypothetical protein